MGLPWQHLSAWKILDTDFGVGQTFIATWNAWQQDTKRPRALHYVALCEHPCTAEDLLTGCAADPALATLARELCSKWFGLLPGFHRFLLAHGQVVLTVCVGDTLGLLRAQQFEADAVDISAQQVGMSDPSWFLKALTRCCYRGTRATLHRLVDVDLAALQTTLSLGGFTACSGDPSCGQAGASQFSARFDPPWMLKATREGALQAALPIARCAVIGAGLAGASVAAALARRGWQVTVLDMASAPARGASGLPVGLMVPHVSSDDCALSRLSRAGIRMMLQQASELLEINQDWAPSGVLERQVGGTPKLPAAWSPLGEQWCEDYREQDTTQHLGTGIWHRHGAWIKPAALVKAWLSQPDISFQPNAEVADVRRQAGVWELVDASGVVLCTAERVVFANACGAFHLLQKMHQITPTLFADALRLPSTQGMRGVLSWEVHNTQIDAGFPPFPVNGSGSVIPRIPLASDLAWYVGSSYQPENQIERSDLDNHRSNLDHLNQLLPALAKHLAPTFTTGALKTWHGTRCVTAHRLPAVGPIDRADQPGLWLCAGMGSRGLSFSVLCAELLAAQFGAEPLPIEAKLAQSLKAVRQRA